MDCSLREDENKAVGRRSCSCGGHAAPSCRGSSRCCRNNLLIGGEEDDHTNKAVLAAAMLTASDSNINGDSIFGNAASGGNTSCLANTAVMKFGCGCGVMRVMFERKRDRGKLRARNFEPSFVGTIVQYNHTIVL